MITTPLLLGLLALVVTTSFIGGVFGMAGGMILMGVLLLYLPVPAAMVLHAVTQMSSNGWRALLWGKYIVWPILGRYMIGLAASLAIFALVRFVPDRALVLLLLGLSPFVVVVLPERFALQADRRGGAEICGLLCSALQFLSGVSGPSLDIFFVRTVLDRPCALRRGRDHGHEPQPGGARAHDRRAVPVLDPAPRDGRGRDLHHPGTRRLHARLSGQRRHHRPQTNPARARIGAVSEPASRARKACAPSSSESATAP